MSYSVSWLADTFSTAAIASMLTTTFALASLLSQSLYATSASKAFSTSHAMHTLQQYNRALTALEK